MKTFDKLYEDWGNATDGKSIEEFIYDYMADELFVERQLVKVNQEMMAEQLKQERNKAIDEAIVKVDDLLLASDPMFGVALYAVKKNIESLKH